MLIGFFKSLLILLLVREVNLFDSNFLVNYKFGKGKYM
jgi:hypothetical protein